MEVYSQPEQNMCSNHIIDSLQEWYIIFKGVFNDSQYNFKLKWQEVISHLVCKALPYAENKAVV